MNSPNNTSTSAAVSATGLHKSYGEKVGLDDVDRTVREAEVVALLGPNGAGKTTIVRILSTLIPADAGVASIMGHDLRRDPAAVRTVIGVTGQYSAVDNLLTGEENLLLTSVSGANGSALPLQFLLPFLSSTFVPVDSMPAGVRWFAANQPFTAVVDSLRALLTGAPVGNSAYVALAWCAAIALVGYLWTQAAFRRGAR